MNDNENGWITVAETVAGDPNTVWKLYTSDDHIVHWHYATDTWHTPRAVSDLQPGGRFVYRMESRDGSAGFDFDGVFDTVEKPRRLRYTLSDGRRADVRFDADGGRVRVTVAFEPDGETDRAMQEAGWQAILTNFRKYAESRDRGPGKG